MGPHTKAAIAPGVSVDDHEDVGGVDDQHLYNAPGPGASELVHIDPGLDK